MARLLVYETETLNEVKTYEMREITSLFIRDGAVRICTVHGEVISFPISTFSVITID